MDSLADLTNQGGIPLIELEDGALHNERKNEILEKCYDDVDFDLPGWYLATLGIDKRKPTSPGEMQGAWAKFFNEGNVGSADYDNCEFYNKNRKSTLGGISKVDFQIDSKVRCGLLAMLSEKTEVVPAMYIEIGTRLVLIRNVEDFVLFMCKKTQDLEKRYGDLIIFDKCVIAIRKDPDGARWVVISEPSAADGVLQKRINATCRVVLTEKQYNLVVDCMRIRARGYIQEIKVLATSYNMLLRDTLTKVRSNIRSDCRGCVTSTPGDSYICANYDSRMVHAQMMQYLRKRTIACINPGLLSAIINIEPILHEAAARLVEEMADEERMLRAYVGGLPFYVKPYNQVEQDSMDDDEGIIGL